jgi:hypothetical protein
MPLNRKQQKPLISDLAIDLFEEMSTLRCTCSAEVIAKLCCHRKDEGCPGCVKWWEKRPRLRRATGGRIWEEFMIISRHPPDRRRSWPADSEEGRWLALEQASEARRQARAKLTPATTPAVSEPEQEPDTASRAPRRQKRGPPESGNGAPDVPAAPPS